MGEAEADGRGRGGILGSPPSILLLLSLACETESHPREEIAVLGE